jgi:hypothetical protein
MVISLIEILYHVHCSDSFNKTSTENLIAFIACRTQGHIFLYEATAANCQRLRSLSDIANSHLPASLIPLKLNTFFSSSEEDSKRNVPLSNT